jgi:hypothetical protein
MMADNESISLSLVSLYGFRHRRFMLSGTHQQYSDACSPFYVTVRNRRYE